MNSIDLDYLKEKLPEDFWGKLDFSQWYNIFQGAHGDLDFLKLALQGMLKTAKTFDEWRKIYKIEMNEIIISDPADTMRLERDLKPAQNTAFNMMIQTASTYLQWYELLDKIRDDQELKNEAVEKAVNLIQEAGEQPFEHWQNLFRNIPTGNKLEKTALSKMLASAKTFDHFFQIYHFKLDIPEAKKTALDKMLQTATTYEDWKRIYELKDEKIDLKKQALENMFKLSNSAEECQEISDKAKEIGEEKLSNAAFMKMAVYGDCAVYRATLTIVNPCDTNSFDDFLGCMIDSAETFSDCESAIIYCIPRKRFFDKLRPKMFSLAKTFHDWSVLIRCCGSRVEMQEKALAKMLELASKPDEYLKVYEESFYSASKNLDQLRQKILARVSQFKMDFEQWLNIYNDSTDFIRKNDDGKITDMALLKIFDQATSFVQHEKILNMIKYHKEDEGVTETEEELFHKILLKAGQLASTVDQYIYVFLLAPTESEIRIAMIEKMQEWYKN